MEMILVAIPLIFYLILIVAFFRMTENIVKIRKATDHRSGKYWLTEYNKAKVFEDTDSMKKAIQSAVFYDIANASDVDKKRTYDNNKHLHHDKFTSLGLQYPEWDRDSFN